MSELVKSEQNERQFRWKLLVSASALTLLGCTTSAFAQTGEPQLWIELGGQLTRLDVGQETYSPEVMSDRAPIFAPSTDYEKLPHQSFDESGKISFQPKGSDWIFSAGIRYGRSVRHVDEHHATYPVTLNTKLPTNFGYGFYLSWAVPRRPKSSKFANTIMKANESHFLLDFQAGKDVGLGLFGGGSSQINLGVRFAQFNNKSNIALNSDPDRHVVYKYLASYHANIWNGEVYHSNVGKLQAQRSFRGIGPSLSWNSTSPVLGNRDDGEVTLDIGANAAVLFGRQRAKVAHQTSVYYHGPSKYGPRTLHAHTAAAHSRSRNVVVPNIGAMAGMTYRVHDFKLSLGYRADFFFNAMDGGNDMRRSENVGNYGPFATVSIGLGG